jgi:hypothetical protein
MRVKAVYKDGVFEPLESVHCGAERARSTCSATTRPCKAVASFKCLAAARRWGFGNAGSIR